MIEYVKDTFIRSVIEQPLTDVIFDLYLIGLLFVVLNRIRFFIENKEKKVGLFIFELIMDVVYPYEIVNNFIKIWVFNYDPRKGKTINIDIKTEKNKNE